MNDLAYLQDTAWLAEREQKWQALAKEWLSEKPKEEVASRKAYFFDGNIQHLLNDKYDLALYTVISESPFRDAQTIIACIAEYWLWVLESPETRDYVDFYTDINERFMAGMHAVFSYDDYLHPEACIGLFHWLYGETYQSDRELTLSHQGKTISIPVTIDIDNLCFTLSNGIINYLWSQSEELNSIVIFKTFIPYFLSIYPQMQPVFFGTKLPESRRFHGEDGKLYFRKYWIYNRRLLTTLNGYITQHEKGKNIEELVCNDEAALAQLRNGLEALDMPDEFYQLKEFVHKHKGDSLYASE